MRLFYLFTIVFFFQLVYVGYQYVKVGIQNKNAKKISFIDSNGRSMNNREVYVLTVEELGIK